MAAGVPFLFKQWGEWAPIDMPWMTEAQARLASNEQWFNAGGGSGFHGTNVWRMRRVGKGAARRFLDGRTHDEFPEVGR
jgi:hypothetical protein